MYPFLVEEIVALAKIAGKSVMKFYEEGFDVYEKADASPVTQADIAAEKIIFTGLQALTPDIPVVGEEHCAQGEVPSLKNRYFWLVDPIDGTKEFIAKNGEFTVNIALIDEDAPVFGVVLAPAINALYFTQSPVQSFSVVNGKTTLLKTRSMPFDGATVLHSRSHYRQEQAAQMLKKCDIKEYRSRGSSLKFCDIAGGTGDVYPCTHETHEWDTAAAHAVLAAAGGTIVDTAGKELTYRKPDFENSYVLALGDKSAVRRLI